MDDKELLEALGRMMDEKLQPINNRLDGLERGLQETKQTLRLEIGEMGAALDTKVQDEIRGVKVLIENDIGKRIETLFDGYKLTHEKQWELEKKLENLEERLERLEVQAG